MSTSPKATVHHTGTPLHLALSCYPCSRRRRLLMTGWAQHKPTWPGAWTNSVGDHPAPGEDVHDAVCWRMRAEAGVRVGAVVEQLPDDPLAAEPQPCLALPPALRRWR